MRCLFFRRERCKEKTNRKNDSECQLSQIAAGRALKGNAVAFEVRHHQAKEPLAGRRLPRGTFERREVDPAHHKNQKPDGSSLAVDGGEPVPREVHGDCTALQERHENHKQRYERDQ